jgi:hypothetical protein
MDVAQKEYQRTHKTSQFEHQTIQVNWCGSIDFFAIANSSFFWSTYSKNPPAKSNMENPASHD